ncbi:DEAD/DEAH box helicase [Pseudidiomarina gelatinasegens]|jgi:ATP-dependent RNA helicase RhlE|uniref:DEAD-box ATP-dependent RNA helicase RhpA n=1 Tax=Pseudidiomarina gelatinasegens TaxID=2487740 RepID=A0A443YVK7_9GAMM|nr:DEAD/DEAH box helicase [Pseudidiomarina gelatinasegens]RWU08006.1 DEAD/DEAH box helicase [Pseudidiomarina gelatinasegens]|tara:strand:+ start:2987 stop:4258 length:1272 start_codon:yes stop_codon:yes gene_type:complete
MTFSELGLCPEILAALTRQGYTEPTPIQEQAIPAVLAGNDVMAAAQTGTGKTAGFALPILEMLKGNERAKPNTARVLILTPTRELAAQVAESVATYGTDLPLNYAVVFGGVKINPQMMKLRKGVDILIATPGRLLDLYQQNAIRFPKLEILVLDEADRMLDMGFIHDIKKIIKVLPAKRQTLMFSATFSSEIRTLAKGLVNNPVEISVAPPNSTAERIEQTMYAAQKSQKPRMLMQILRNLNLPQVIVFSRTKHGANKLVKQLDADGFLASAIHGNKSQGARTKALAEFKAGKVQVLVATDIAARGLDIEKLPYVINYDLPQVAEDYVHRIGRTGRAGQVGHAISLVMDEEFRTLKAIEKLIGQPIERHKLEGFADVVLNGRTPAPAQGQRQPRQPRRQGSSQGRGAAKPAGGNKRRSGRGDS